MDNSSGVGVLDKAVVVLDCLEEGPKSLSGLVEASGLPRPTAYRLAVALEHHRLVVRDRLGRFTLGPRLTELATSATNDDPLLSAAPDVLARLRDATGESAQLYRRDGDVRRCVVAAERASGLRDTVPVGLAMPLTAGSAAQVLLAWEPTAAVEPLLAKAAFSAATLAHVRRRGWAASVAEREPGVASVSAPVRDGSGRVAAAVSVSGPIDRLTRTPGRRHSHAVLAAAEALSRAAERR